MGMEMGMVDLASPGTETEPNAGRGVLACTCTSTEIKICACACASMDMARVLIDNRRDAGDAV